MGEVRNRNILIGIVDNDPYALKVFGTLIERMSSDFAVIWTCDLGAVAISRCLSPTSLPPFPCGVTGVPLFPEAASSPHSHLIRSARSMGLWYGSVISMRRVGRP